MTAEPKPRGRPRVAHPNIRSIYITDDDVEWWEKFKEVMREDGTSASAQIMIWIYQWFEKHPTKKDRNPQTALTRFDHVIPLSEAAKENLVRAPPTTPNYSTMTIPELQDCLKKRFLSDFDRMAITFFLKKAEAHLK